MRGQLVPVTGDELGLGDHVAFFFKNNAERFAFVIPYIVKGLRNNERCVYVAHENKLADIRAEFDAANIDVDGLNASGALSIVTTRDSYLRSGVFEPKRMIDDLDRDVRLALQLGFSGLRVTGEMTWALDLPSAFGLLCEYEEELCQRWPMQLGGLCQYHEPLFPVDLMEKIPNWHCSVVRGGQILRDHTHRTAA
ncbi:MAG TPA: MEDS domain-containing protein [Candidatus Acidoferrales bacterium]